MRLPELREDRVVDRAVIIAPERLLRPNDYAKNGTNPTGVGCPFCPGNEHFTPSEIMACRPKDSGKDMPGWTLRVVPNKFPVLSPQVPMERESPGSHGTIGAVGAHEVIIESPDHGATLATLPVPDFGNLLAVFQTRLQHLRRDPRLRYALVFKNHGEAAGASLEHAHSQLVALPGIPPAVAAELRSCKAFFNRKNFCFFCDMLGREQESAQRLVLSGPDYLVVSPYASRFSFETWILPRRHSATYEESTDPELNGLAEVFSQTLNRLDKVLDNPAYSFVLRTAPFGDAATGADDAYHWRIEIMPRLSRIAGLELGTGLFINPIAPETAAAFLREGRPYA